ncbi:CpaF/VirB11 family protein [Cohaesibacter celericrescens]|uniref:Type II/IV secretion system protein n=1 Tax=Cohaesibacter celericrescens TaxID=2067669 RepID=A0A2N5XRR7_9HYPH|nr:CpaF/VirB11 family protein [Cohaesibacter celericrescens]PLW77189.1 type II/IV secretion system protein [Cohaesibacter celericrescens]
MSNMLVKRLLEPLSRHYDSLNVIELLSKKSGEIVLEVRGEKERFKRIEEPELTRKRILEICHTLSCVGGLEFNPDKSPKLSTRLPGNHRFECLLGNSVASDLSLAIRCKHPYDVSLEQMGLDKTTIDYLRHALDSQWNIAISGSTNTGKTTLLNKFLSFLPDDRRVVSAEDTLELEMDRFFNGVSLIAARDSSAGAGFMDWQQLFDHQMRISPDNLIYGEISTQNAFAALNVLNTGARGWLCTVHAESAAMVPSRFQENINASGQHLPDVAGFMSKLIDLVVHIRRTDDGRRFVSEIYEMKNDHYVMRRMTPDRSELAA